MLRIHWFLPTGGDSRNIVATSPEDSRPPTLDYLASVASAADQCGFTAVLTPCGTGCEDAWITAAALIPHTRRLQFLVATRPGFINPTQAAQMASTFQRHSNGRIHINIVTGAEPRELARFGDFLDKEARYVRTGDFMEVLRGAWQPEPHSLHTEYYRVEEATTRETPDPVPEIYFGGASEGAELAAARGADVYLTWGETPEMVKVRLDRMRERAHEAGRSLRFGIRFHAIARPTSEAAWTEAHRLLDAVPEEARLAAQRDFASSQSEGQQRMTALSQADDLEIYPNVWSGIGSVRGGAGTALVGSFEEVADRIEEYAELGIEEFIMSGYPHLEEAWTFGEGVLPILAARGRIEAPHRTASNVFHFR